MVNSRDVFILLQDALDRYLEELRRLRMNDRLAATGEEHHIWALSPCAIRRTNSFMLWINAM